MIRQSLCYHFDYLDKTTHKTTFQNLMVIINLYLDNYKNRKNSQAFSLAKFV